MISICGVVEHIQFVNKENNYTVCHVRADKEILTLVGVMPSLEEGESIVAHGEWQNHQVFGRQLRVEYYERKLPSGTEAICKYLSTGIIKGIGPVTAERIVEKYGEHTFEVIENNPLWLCDIKGISQKRALDISKCFIEQNGMTNIIMFCGKYFGVSCAVRIYNRYGDTAIPLIEKNPYALCGEVVGVTFEKADKVGASIGFPPDSDERIEAGIRYVLNNVLFQNGHCYLPENELVEQTSHLLSVDSSKIKAVLLRVKGTFVIMHIYCGVECYALDYIDEAERYTADKLQQIASEDIPFRLSGIEAEICALEVKYGFTYAQKQREAITFAVTNGVTVVTGGPGTGKTTVIKAIIEIFSKLKISFALAAPTGRAAKRMSEASGYEATTIHRLLEMKYGEDDGNYIFNRNEDDPLKMQALIIDEMSMVDALLMQGLLKAVKVGTYLIMIGDVDQLPPVGAGNVLCDIINSGKFNVVRLEEIFRQAKDSLIILNAHKINKGINPALDSRDNDFFFIKRYTASDIAETVASLCSKRLPQRYGIDAVDDIQVVTPTRKGELGTAELNKLLQIYLNPYNTRKAEKHAKGVIFRENDKVMQIKNNYTVEWTKNGADGVGIFNGDIGRIVSINVKNEDMTIDFDGRIVIYEFAMLEELEHAFAITVHKSQGSEYPYVIMPLFSFPPMLMTRNLFYTAVTRARDMVILVGNDNAVYTMVANNRKSKRYSALAELISPPNAHSAQ